VNRSFLKRGLLLSAASATLLSFAAYADDLDINSATTSAVKTSAANNGAGDITIGTNGSITITQAGPAVTLDSSNNVSVFGSISNKGTDGAQGILIDTGTNDTPATLTGDLLVLSSGQTATIDLSGSGANKTGIGLGGNGTLTGDIAFTSGTISIQGDNSAGIGTGSDSTLDGNLLFGGTLVMTPTTANETNTTGITGIALGGDVTGNVENSGQIQIYGNGSRGFVSTGTISGHFKNMGLIGTEGFQTSQNQSTGAVTVPKGTGDPLAGSAVSIGGSILKGFMNAGPDGTTAGAGTATISMDGGGLGTPVLYVSPAIQGVSSPTAIEIGTYDADTVNPGYAFYNRGSIGLIGGTTLDPNLSVAGVVFAGTSATAGVKLDGLGFFNSGTIAVGGRTTGSGNAPITAVALGIGSVGVNDTGTANGGFVTVGDGSADSGIYNSGSITAVAQGDLGATAIAIDIGKTSIVKSINNTGTIGATVNTNNPSTVQIQQIYAINDQNGSLSKITNTGTISAATTTPITAGPSIAVAAYLRNNTTGVTFNNGTSTDTGSVVGDIYFGSGADTLTVTGVSDSQFSGINGNIDFGSNVNNSGTTDKLNIGAFGVVTGQITETDLGMLDVNIASGGTLNVLNNSVRQSLLVNDLTMANNAHLNIAVSTQLPDNVSISGTDITINGANANTIGVVFSSFIPATGRFVLLEAPTGNLHIDNVEQVQAGINSHIPFLFTGSAAYLTDQSGLDQLVLDLTPKSAATLGLSGYAAEIFPYANAALENDDTLGAAMISGIADNASAQAAYSQFAPDASGGTRAIAISLTDHATGPVAARQRALRLYARQPGDLTLWGQEFAQQISDKGSDGLPGFKDSGFGFALGADGGDALGGWYGGAFTFYTGNVDQRAPQSSRNNTQWYMLSGYSTWRGKGLFLDTQLTAGYGDFSAHRFISIGGVTRQANSKRSGVLGAAGMTTGANLVYGNTTLTPNIAIDGLTMREEGYTETGGGGTTGDAFDLHVNPVLMSSLRAFVGVNARQDVNFGSFFMQPELRVGYRYDLLADRIDLTAHFPGVTGTGPGSGDFTITGPQPSKGNLLAGASIAATTGAWSIGLNYDMLSGNNGSMTQVGTVSLVGRI
jgi:hypothetical protein